MSELPEWLESKLVDALTPVLAEHWEKYGMSEPITLYKDGEAMTVSAPSWAKELQAQGWSLQPTGGIWANNGDDDVPFSFHDDDAEPEPAPKPRRGRKPKATKA